MIVLYDLINIFLLIILILFLNKKNYLNNNISIFLILTCFVPFFWNDFLISRHYFPDQRNYFDLVKSIRNLEWPTYSKFNILYGYLNAFSPIPFLERINSLGYVNKLYFIFFLCFIYNNYFFKNKLILYILPLYPSLIIYSSMALRETFIVINMVLIFIFLINKNYISLIFSLIIFYYLKIYYFIILLPIIITYLLYFNINSLINFNTRVKFLLIPFSFICIILFLFIIDEQLIYSINKLRWNAWYEAYGSRNNYYDYESVFYFIFNFPNFLIKYSFYPLISNTKNFFQFIAGLEITITTLFILFLFISLFKKREYRKFFFWFLIYIYISIIIAGIIENIGTISRYRLPFVLSFVYILLFENNYIKKKYDSI